MKQNTRPTFPWALAVFLSLFILFSALAVTSLVAPTPQPAPEQPSQPDHGALFESLFAQPDWEALYALAGIQDTEFETADTFAAYMSAKVGSAPLRYQQVQTEDAAVCRYLVYLGEEKIAAFTTSAPQWTVDTVELFFQRSNHITAQVPPEYTVLVNGVPLDESFTIRTAETKAESYLPEGLHGYRRKWQSVTGLLVMPQVTAMDETGNAIPLSQDPETGIFRLPEAAPAQITEAEAAFARQAAMADARYAIADISNAQLREYFDANSPVYKMLVTNPRNIQKHTSSSIDEDAILLSQYCRYGDGLFSVNVKLTQNIIRTSGTLKVYQLDKTYFISTIDGQYRVTAYTSEYVTEVTEQVRLTFVTDDGEIVQTVPGDALSVTTPQIDGLMGWATRSIASDGTVILTVRVLPDGTLLGDPEPMTLYPVYQ